MLPNLIIIGAFKSGTTSLHYYLGLHPDISMSKEKELRFFVEGMNWEKGIEWYESQFTGPAAIHGEASPSYTDYPFHGGVPARMHAVVPEAKLIYILRDPVERIISDYVQEVADGREERTLTEALADVRANRYLLRSQYYLQLEQYLPYYPPSRILILTLEELNCRRRETLKRVFRFLDVDDSFESVLFARKRHRSWSKRRKTRVGASLSRLPMMAFLERLPPDVGGIHVRELAKKVIYFPFSRKVDRPSLDGRLREAVIEYLRDDVSRLRKFTGLAFEMWCL